MNNYYHILKPIESKPRKVDILLSKPSVIELEHWWPEEKLIAVDFESKGSDPTAEDFAVVGLGVASATKVVYIHLLDMEKEPLEWVKQQLAKHELVAFNVAFDGAAALRWTGRWLKWVGDAYALFRLLATEGYPDQRWNLETAEKMLLSWPESNKDAMNDWLVAHGHTNNMGRPNKAALHLAPFEVIGPYCAADADACFQLWEYPFKEALREFPGLREYAERFSMCLIKLVVEQQFYGIAIDALKLEGYHTQLLHDIKECESKWLNLPEVKPHVDLYNNTIVSQHKTKEPSKITKSGKESKNWIKWDAQLTSLIGANHFNLNSDQQLRWLLYEQLNLPVTLRTESGKPAVSGKVLGQMGEIGKLLVSYNELCKEEGYVSTCRKFVRKNGELHIPLKVHSTLSGRCAGGGGINIQQLPKSEGYLSCFVSRPGKVWIDADLTSIEPVVLAEYSKDPTMLKLYNNLDKKQDVYLFNACHIAGLKEKVRKFYNPEFPTEESIKIAKHECKIERDIAKTATLALNYGCSPNKLHETITLGGIDISLDQCRTIYYSYWKLYSGIKDFESKLIAEWNERKGWIYNGFGRPLAIDYNRVRDIVNSFVQATAHDVLLVWLYFVDQLRLQSKLDFKFIIADWHDQFLLETDEVDGQKVKELVERALVLTNEFLKGTIVVRSRPKLVHNLWESKS